MFIVKVLRGASFKKLNEALTTVKKKSGQSKFYTLLDILNCAIRYGAGYYDYMYFGFYDLKAKERKTYVTRFRNKKILDKMNKPEFFEEFNDKTRFIKHFKPFLFRDAVNAADEADLFAFLDKHDSFIAKPARGCGGKRIELLHTKDFASHEAVAAYLKEKGLSIIEEIVQQHPDMAKLHPASVNTLRIVTDKVGDTVHIAYVDVKIGRSGCFCDNSGQGGMFCTVDKETGKICSHAVDDYLEEFLVHPDTGIQFEGYQIPFFKEALELAKQAAQTIPEIGHIGWDIGISPNGPVVIEGNPDAGVMCQFAAIWPGKEGLWPYYQEILGL